MSQCSRVLALSVGTHISTYSWDESIPTESSDIYSFSKCWRGPPLACPSTRLRGTPSSSPHPRPRNAADPRCLSRTLGFVTDRLCGTVDFNLDSRSNSPAAPPQVCRSAICFRRLERRRLLRESGEVQHLITLRYMRTHRRRSRRALRPLWGARVRQEALRHRGQRGQPRSLPRQARQAKRRLRYVC